MRKLPALLIVPILLLMAGCGTLDPSGPYGSDKILYDADYAIAAAYETVHTFVKWEYDNRAALATTPQIKAAADEIRRTAPKAFQTALAARDAYSANQSGTNKDALTSALSVIHALVLESMKYLTLKPVG